MDELEKAKIRITKWKEHNASHQKEYEHFADQLDLMGEKEAAQRIRELVALQEKGIQILHQALVSLEH